MNITINPGAATDDAAQIDSIVSTMQEDMEVLDNAIKKNIPDGVQTTWSDTVRNNWENYYSSDIPSAMEGMKLSATNLRKAVEQALAYDQERG
jgi:hypothetical protein